MAKSKAASPGRRAAAKPTSQPAEPVAYRKSTTREYFESIVIAVVLALFVRTFAVQAFKIPTGSMENNLLIGDHLLVNKFVHGPAGSSLERVLLPVRPIARGDVIVFKYPEEPERDFIKRVVGLPGETVELRERTVYIDGTAIDEPYAQYMEPGRPGAPDADPGSGDVRRWFGPVTVPPDHYYVMGDNRDNSQDSRYWRFLPRGYVKGRAMMIYWSFDGEGGDAGLVSGVTGLVTRTRWSRLLRQIH
ncbi:MAG: signal peptidase I [Acidimicrobiia bacterium]|nr:signal peptidase I [Acidimicrobiia bacterium]